MSASVAADVRSVSDDDPVLRVDLKRAFRAIERLSKDPEDIAQGFVIVDSLAGQAPLRVLSRFRQNPVGRKLLIERPSLIAKLNDRDALERLSPDSLAHEYLRVLDRNGISADGLKAASIEGRGSAYDERSEYMFVRDRIRDSHDLWHAVTGYRADAMGEIALLAFTAAQLRNPGIGVLVFAALASSRELAFSKVITSAFRRGLRATWLPPVRWETLLPLPLDEVRALLGIEPYAVDPAASSLSEQALAQA
ncbi:MAG TPA: Coq4 family protein [Polyangiales bacterium]